MRSDGDYPTKARRIILEKYGQYTAIKLNNSGPNMNNLTKYEQIVQKHSTEIIQGERSASISVFLSCKEWTELMSASLRAETFRERARHYVQDVWLLQKPLGSYGEVKKPRGKSGSFGSTVSKTVCW